MAILDLQRRLREIGRIRIGAKTPTGNGKSRPAKLDKFRLTSPDRQTIEAAARIYGGTAQKWTAGDGGQQWETFTDAISLPVVVPPGDLAFSQHYELWASGGCQRRCDGQWEQIGDQPCPCAASDGERECKPHTRLNVMIPDLPGLGVWRLETSGYYAAVELAGVVDVCRAATAAGRMLPARLRLEQRSVKRAGEGVKRFAVPVLDVDVPLQSLGLLSPTGQSAVAPTTAVAIEAAPSWQPVPVDALPPAPSVPISDQIAAEPEPKRRRANAQQPIQPTGLKPRPAAQAAPPVDGWEPPWDDVPAEPKPARPLTPAQKLAMRVRDVCGPIDDQARHALYGQVLGRAPVSGNDLSDDELDQVHAHLDDLADATTAAASSAPTEEAGWKALGAEHGITQAAILRQARTVALTLGIDPPGRLGAIKDQALADTVHSWVLNLEDAI